MKQFLIALFCLIGSFVGLHAQTDIPAQRRIWDDAYMQEQRRQYDSLMADTIPLAAQAANERLNLRWNNPSLGLGGYGLGAYGLGGWGSAYGLDNFGWRLHEGFNAQFGLSLSAGLGKHAPSGVGFGQTAAFAYVAPLTKKLSVAAGLFATNYDWGSWRSTNVGIGGVLAYQVNDKISLYAYGQKTFLPQKSLFSEFHRNPFPAFFDQPRDVIGAAAEFKIGENAMIGISVERRTYDTPLSPR